MRAGVPLPRRKPFEDIVNLWVITKPRARRMDAGEAVNRRVKHLFYRGFLRRVLDDASGGVSTLIGLSLPVVIGGVGLAFDVNRGLEQHVINQRAADMGALGAAMAYKASNDEAILEPSAIDLARANGLTGASVDAAVVNDYPNSGDKSVQVTVTTQVPYTLARVLGLSGSYDVTATSAASLVTQAQYAPPCFLALGGVDKFSEGFLRSPA